LLFLPRAGVLIENDSMKVLSLRTACLSGKVKPTTATRQHVPQL